MPASTHISLSELQALIKRGIDNAHPLPYWVTAEISELKVNYSGHCYIEPVSYTHLRARKFSGGPGNIGRMQPATPPSVQRIARMINRVSIFFGFCDFPKFAASLPTSEKKDCRKRVENYENLLKPLHFRDYFSKFKAVSVSYTHLRSDPRSNRRISGSIRASRRAGTGLALCRGG